MADSPTFKIQYEYQGPSNVEAEVPGSQKIREADENTFGNSAEDIRELDGAVKQYENGGYSITRTSYSEVRSEVVQGSTVTRTTVRLSGEESNIDVVSKEEKGQAEERKPKTKIPKLKFRQAAEKVRSERRRTKEKKEEETPPPLPKSSIPKLARGSKIPPPTTKPYVIKREISTEVSMLPDDEFEKIYEEIVDNDETEVMDDNILYNKVDDPDKLDSKFEEIIHDYEDNKIQPINVEKLRQSRIPSWKRKGIEVDASKTIKVTTEKSKVRSIPRLKEISMRVKADDDGVNQMVTRKYTKTISTENVLPADGNKFENNINAELSRSPFKYISTGGASKISKFSKVITTEKTSGWKETENKWSKNDDTNITRIQRSISVANSGLNSKGTVKESGSKISGLHRSISLSSNDQSKLSTNTDNKVNVMKVKSQTENIVKESIKIGTPVFESHVSKFENMNEDNLQTAQLKQSITVLDDREDGADDVNNNTQLTDNKYEVVTERKIYQIKDENPNVSGSITITRISTDMSDSGNNVEIKQIDNTMHSLVNSESIIEQPLVLKGDINTYISENAFEVNKNQIDNLNDSNIIKHDTYIVKSPEVEKIKIIGLHKKSTEVVEEISALKGKVGRLVNKIGSNDLQTATDTSKRDMNDELPKKKSILSKIAMFERQNIDESMPRRKLRPEKLIIKDAPQEPRPHVHTPKIVEEVLKPGQSNLDFSVYESKFEVTSPHIGLKTDNNLDIVSKQTIELEGSTAFEHNIAENKQQNLEEHRFDRTQSSLDYGVIERRIEVDSKYSRLVSDDFAVEERLESKKESNNDKHDVGRIELKAESDMYNSEVENASNKIGIKIAQQKTEGQSISPVQRNVEFAVYKSTGKIKVEPNLVGIAHDENLNAQTNISTESKISGYYEHNTAEAMHFKAEAHKSYHSVKTNLSVDENVIRDDSKQGDITANSHFDIESNVASQFKNIYNKFEHNALGVKHSQKEEQKTSPVQNRLSFDFDKDKVKLKDNVISDAPVILVSPKINVSKTIQRNFSITSDENKVGISKTSKVEESKIVREEQSPIRKNLDFKSIVLKGNTYQIKDTSKTTNDQVIPTDNLTKQTVISEKIDNAVQNQFGYEKISKGATIISNNMSKLETESSESLGQYETIQTDSEIINKGLTKKHVQMYENIKGTFKSGQKQQYEEITRGAATVSDTVIDSVNVEWTAKENTEDHENILPISEVTRAGFTKKHVSTIENIENVDNAFKSSQKQIQYEEITIGTAAISETVTSTVNFESKSSVNTKQYEDIRLINEIVNLTDSLSDANNEDVFSETNEIPQIIIKCKRSRYKEEENDVRRVKSLAELDLGDAVKGKVNSLIFRMKSMEQYDLDKKEIINIKEMPRKMSVLEKIAMFERKITPIKMDNGLTNGRLKATVEIKNHNIKNKIIAVEEYTRKIEEFNCAKEKYGTVDAMPSLTLRNGVQMPVLAVGTAMLDPRLTPFIIRTAIDLGYRAIDTGFIYGNEKDVGEGIRAKIDDRTVRREDLFIIGKLWSTFHRSDLVEQACRASLQALGLDYFDLYLIHNPMSFKEGGDPIPKIATVIQYSAHDFMDAWYGMEKLVTKGLVKAIGVSNFNSIQIQRILDKGTVKPAVNQVECHPYLSQRRLDAFCSDNDILLSCFGTLGSKGTPLEYKTGLNPVIDDPLVQVMASGLNVTAAQLLIRYQIECGHSVVVKSSSAAHLWDNLQALSCHLTPGQVEALHALNRNKRTFAFKGMGDTHKNYPFMVAF